MWLGATSAESFIEKQASGCTRAKGHVRSLEEHGLPRLSVSTVMITNGASEPGQHPHWFSECLVECNSIMNAVPAAEPSELIIDLEMMEDTRAPIGVWNRVVVDLAKNVGPACLESGITRRDDAALINANQPQGDCGGGVSRQETYCLAIAGLCNDNNVVWRERLTLQAVQASCKVPRATMGADEYSDRQSR